MLGASFVASAINAGAGGGSFISFPAVLAIGVMPVQANATNNVAMSLGSVASAGSFRSELDVPRPLLWRMLAASTIGSVAGALLLLRTGNASFEALIPYLLLGATLLFVAGPALSRLVERSGAALGLDSPLGLAAQTLIAVYGGFFGAAIGILMLAMLQLLGVSNLRQANALKLLLATVINGVAIVPFVWARAIVWEPAVFMSAGAIAGGLLGAGVVKRLPGIVLRRIVIAVASAMTIYFFWKNYAR